MLSFEKTVYGFSRKLNILSGIALLLMMGLVFVNVALRAVGKPILGTYEFTGFLASITITFALAHCASKKGHIAINYPLGFRPFSIRSSPFWALHSMP
jgi:TRAP-type C4-dicarboxylate transport system permease small subunit